MKAQLHTQHLFKVSKRSLDSLDKATVRPGSHTRGRSACCKAHRMIILGTRAVTLQSLERLSKRKRHPELLVAAGRLSRHYLMNFRLELGRDCAVFT
jgi:hypothetical protein